MCDLDAKIRNLDGEQQDRVENRPSILENKDARMTICLDSPSPPRSRPPPPILQRSSSADRMNRQFFPSGSDAIGSDAQTQTDGDEQPVPVEQCAEEVDEQPVEHVQEALQLVDFDVNDGASTSSSSVHRFHRGGRNVCGQLRLMIAIVLKEMKKSLLNRRGAIKYVVRLFHMSRKTISAIAATPLDEPLPTVLPPCKEEKKPLKWKERCIREATR
jgi:hypothetical protein